MPDPPEPVSCWLYGVPTAAEGKVDGVMARALLTVRVTGSIAEAPWPSVTVTSTV